jgi:hypothetical protein
MRRDKRKFRGSMVRFAAFVVVSCLAWGLPASAQASSSPPEAQTEPAEAIPGGARLKGKVNPGGLPTTYYFEYARDTCDEGCTPSKTATGGPLAGNTMQEVPAVEVTGLAAGGTEKYWYQVVASNADGTVYGGLVNFTPGAPLPSISGESVSHLTEHDATLEAEVNLHEASAGAYYQFQLVKEPSEYASEILCPVKLPPASDGCDGTQSASALPIGFIPGNTAQPGVNLPAILNLANAGVTLMPNTTYHYRMLVARRVPTEDTTQWEPPTVYGANQTFTTPPSIVSESVSNITATDATIEAQINTGGRETTYRVWVGNYPECIEEMIEECDSSAKHPIEGILTGSSSPTRISVDVAHAWHALSPGSSYIYNVDATNSAWAFQGSAYGENKTFTTPAAKAPAIDSESVSHVTPTDATLEAQINTEGLETSYQFQLTYMRCRECMSPTYNIPLPSGLLLGSFLDQSVSLDLNSAGVTLKPGFYEYSLSAASTGGTTAVHGGSFEPPEEVVQPLNTTTPSRTNDNNQGSSSTPTGSGGSPAPGVAPLGPQIVCLCNCARGCHGKKVSPKHLTRAQKLAKALKACKRKPKKQQASCKKQTEKKYAATNKKS